jgi:hypothetical protein
MAPRSFGCAEEPAGAGFNANAAASVALVAVTSISPRAGREERVGAEESECAGIPR